MSLDEFIKSQIKLQDKINRITMRDKLPTNAWMKQISEINRIIPKYPEFYEISKLYGQPIFHNSTLDQINQIGKLMKKITSPVQELNKISSYSKVFSEIEKITHPKSIIETFKLSYLNYDFSELIENFEEEDESTSSLIIEETSRIKNIISDIYHNNEIIYTLKSRQFEELIAELLLKQGFKVELTKQTRDNGYDILALKYINGFSPIKYLVECKRYAEKRKIGVGIIREFKEVLHTENANKGIIVTSSYFSKPAIQKQKETPFLLDYKDKTDVMKWVVDYYSGN